MSTPLIKYIICYFFCIAFCACAKYSAPPTGGPEDKTPPSIVNELSDNNFQTNFNQRKIKLVFDEWITLSNPVKEVVISPPTNKPLIFTSKGKEVVVELAEDEILKENVTYQINFGSAVKDFSVGNVFENYIFVFSTGSVIDSLSVSGKVIDELTGKPIKDILVLLYENRSDSAMHLDKPFYFTKTIEGGSFQLNNLRSDTFQIFALKDENVSYKYDLPEEKVAFSKKLIITGDTTNSGIVLKAFNEKARPVLVSRDHSTKGLLKVQYNGLPKEPSFDFLDRDSVKYFNEFVGDSLLIWYRNVNLDSSKLVITHNMGSDTVFIKKTKNSFEAQLLKSVNIRNNKLQIFQEDSISIIFNRPIFSIDTSKFQIFDSSGFKVIDRIDIDNKQVQLFSQLEADSTYNMMILPNGITDWYGINNVDTIRYEITVVPAAELGKIEFKVVGTDSLNYVFELLTGNETFKKSRITYDRTIIYNRLNPAKYSLRIIKDSNGDGEWTVGSLIGKIRSEQIKEITLDELKKGWELSLDVDLKQIFNGTEIE